jgi:tripartite-type tricarboxylate transporter receptor subunit TctC
LQDRFPAPASREDRALQGSGVVVVGARPWACSEALRQVDSTRRNHDDSRAAVPPPSAVAGSRRAAPSDETTTRPAARASPCARARIIGASLPRPGDSRVKPVSLRRSLAALATVALAAAAPAAFAQGFPSKSIRLLVPLAAGSTADIVSRYAGQELSKALGQPVVIENKPGAGGTIAMAEVARAAPDGYTIAFASQGTLVFNQAIYAKPGYDSLKDFAPVAFVGGVSNVMIVPPGSAATKPLDVVAAAKAKPGESTFSSGGAGTSHHLSGVLFGRLTDTQLVHVPYKGAPQGVLAVMAGEVTMGFFNTPTVIGQIKEGKVKALGVTSLKRSPLLPDEPTLDEQGIRGYEVNTWFGFVAPAGTPADVVARLNGELTRIFASAEAKEKLGPQGFDLAPPMTPAAFGKLIADDLATWVPIVRASGATAN